MLKSLLIVLCILSYTGYATPPKKKTKIESQPIGANILSISDLATKILSTIVSVGGSFKDAINLFTSFDTSAINLNLDYLKPESIVKTFDLEVKQISLGDHTGCLLTDKHDILCSYKTHIDIPKKAWALDTYGTITCAITYEDRSMICWRKNENSSVSLIKTQPMKDTKNIKAITIQGWNEVAQAWDNDNAPKELNRIFFIDSEGNIFVLPLLFENCDQPPSPSPFFTQQQKESIKFKAIAGSQKLFCAISLQDEVYCESYGLKNHGKANLKAKAIAMSDNMLYAITQEDNEVVCANLKHTTTNHPEPIILKPLTTKDHNSYKAKDIQANHEHMCFIEHTLSDNKDDYGFIRCFEKTGIYETKFFPISNLSASLTEEITHLAINKNAYNFSESIPSTVCAVRKDNHLVVCSIIHTPLAPHPDQKNNQNLKYYYLNNFIFNRELEVKSEISQLGETPYATEDKNFKPLAENIIDIVVGSNFVCSLNRDQALRCSVFNTSNTYNKVHLLSPPAGGSDSPSSSSTDPVIQLSAGEHHVCALTQTGRVNCWKPVVGATPLKLERGPLPKMEYITSGDSHNCGIIKENHRVYCWPSHIVDNNSTPPKRNQSCLSAAATNARLEHGTTGSPTMHSAEIDINPPENLGPVESIAAGSMHTCAIQKEKPYSVICWGDQKSGQLNVPANLPQVQSIRAKEHMTCVKETRSGHARCWGYDEEWISDEPVLNDTAYPLISLDQDVDPRNRRSTKVFAYINQNNRVKILQPRYKWKNIIDMLDWVRLQSYDTLLEIFKRVRTRMEDEEKKVLPPF